MGWRIHFTAADLARTRVSGSLGPLAETLTALCMLRSSWQPPPRFSGWREQATRRLTVQMKPLTALIRSGSQAVDLWSLTGHAPTIEQGVGALLTAPREKLLAEMESLDRFARLPGSAWAGLAGGGAVAALLGQTRAAVLAGTADGTSTTELARRAGVSLAAASQHATVLRDAGLISTHWHGRAVRHTLTPLGAALLTAGSAPAGAQADAG
jgi:DNA-binding transcriptional ArsR family regulator